MIAASSEHDSRYGAERTPCVCCGVELRGRAGYCPKCQTPLELSSTVASRGGNQRFVSVLGASGVGKTVYLGLLLDMLSRGPGQLRGLPTSAFSVALQEQVVTALEQRIFPEKTPAEADTWKWVHCELATQDEERKRQLDLVAPDFAGEAIAMEVSRGGLYPAIGHVVSKSAGILILCDSQKVRTAGPAEDLFAMKLASYIAQSQTSRKGSQAGPCSAAIAVVFTKCDGCPDAQLDPQQFAAYNMPRLFEYCRQAFPSHAYFAASVVGSSGIIASSNGARMQTPFHVEPHGITEPIEWIVECCH